MGYTWLSARGAHPDTILKGQLHLLGQPEGDDEDDYPWPTFSLEGSHTLEFTSSLEDEGVNTETEAEEIELGENEYLEDEAGEDQEDVSTALRFPDEVWLNVAAYLDLGSWYTFIRTCWRFHAIGNDALAIGPVVMNDVRRRVADGHYASALVRSWQGLLALLMNQGILEHEVVEHIQPLLLTTGPVRAQLPQALRLLNDEAFQIGALPERTRSFAQQLWVQGTLLFRAQEEANGMFIRELVGLCHTMDCDVRIHITVQRLFALLEEFHHPIQVHVAALNALALLFSEGMLSDKEMQTTLTVMLHIITRQEYPEDTRFASANCIQRLLLGDVLSDLRRGCVLKALIRDITLRRNTPQRRIELMQILDIETLRPILSPRLRGQLIECLPIFMRNVYLNNMAHQYIVDLLNLNIMTEEELVTLANNLHPLVNHHDENMRVRMVYLLTEAILNEHLSAPFRNACARELESLMDDPSLLVAEALMESAVRLYQEHTDPLPIKILYNLAVSLVNCKNVLISNMAMKFIQKFHEEQGEVGLVTMVAH